ncbi:MAG: hypothetical protein AAFY65_12555 [Pseudomonadota bacterium]
MPSRPPKRKRLTPQQKKALSYGRDGRNTSEYPHAARKSIPRGKARSHRAQRRIDRAALAHAPEDAPLALGKPAWKKWPDLPLGAYLETPAVGDCSPRGTQAWDGLEHEMSAYDATQIRLRRRLRALRKRTP